MEYKNIEFPKNSRFLVTGCAGFIGSNLVEEILNLGYYVRGLDNLSIGKRGNMDGFSDNVNFEFIEGDIRDYDMCVEACDGIDFVLHQAAWGSVPRSIKMPLFYEENNIKGTLNMMEAASKKVVKRFVYASSSSVYGDSNLLPKIEGQEGNVLSPYALTKKVNEEYGKLFKDLYGLNTYGLRYFNVFGRRQNPDGAYAAVIPKFINCLMNNEQPTINGDGYQSRDFTYIENVVDANLKACLASEDHSGTVYNIAYGGRVRLYEVYDTISAALNKNIAPIYGPTRIGDVQHSNADIGKAINNLNYKPNWSFKEGIDETINWYMVNTIKR